MSLEKLQFVLKVQKMPKGKQKRRSSPAGQVDLKKLKGSNKLPVQPNDFSKDAKNLPGNQFATLPVDVSEKEEVERREKVPPIFVKTSSSDSVRKWLTGFIKSGSLQASIRLCADGLKILLPSRKDYNFVREFLSRTKIEHFSHDDPGKKPMKVVLRGLYDMDLSVLKEELKTLKLKVIEVFKMTRHNKDIKFRDQLYLVHLEKGTTTLPELKAVRAMFNIIVSWEHYRQVHRDVTQCSNCLQFGHGGRNCFMKSRCATCGGQHKTQDCDKINENMEVKCFNCGGDHSTKNRSCPKRAEFVKIRQQATTRSQPNRRKTTPAFTNLDFPALPSPRVGSDRVVPNLQPLPLNQRQKVAENTTPPGFNQQPREIKPTTTEEGSSDLFSPQELLNIFIEMTTTLRNCKTREEQVRALGGFIVKYSS